MRPPQRREHALGIAASRISPARRSSGWQAHIRERRHAEGRAWQGKTVVPGVFKDPVTGPRRVRKPNVDGDGQGDLAGHGGEQRAVFVYRIESYRYWERELGRNDFVNGQFGSTTELVEGLWVGRRKWWCG